MYYTLDDNCEVKFEEGETVFFATRDWDRKSKSNYKILKGEIHKVHINALLKPKPKHSVLELCHANVSYYVYSLKEDSVFPGVAEGFIARKKKDLNFLTPKAT